MKLKRIYPRAVLLALCCVLPMMASADASRVGEGYVARQENLRTFFDALSAPMGKPIILSKAAARRTITGEFSLAAPKQTLEQIARQMALIWYSDGQAVYVYEAAEARSTVVSLNTITVQKLEGFLRRSGLSDARFPLRNDGLRTFYVSGPPIYVDIVKQAAQFMDSQSAELQLGQQRIGVINLHNTFVGDRKYELRDESITVPGMATAIENLLKGESRGVDTHITKPGGGGRLGAMPDFPGESHDVATSPSAEQPAPKTFARDLAAGNIRVVAYPDTNSLLVKGLPEQVRFIENLAAALDEPKRHVELSLWIIDLQKDDLNELGVDWKGSLKVGSQAMASLNGGSLSTLDGVSFMAAIAALESDNRARVVSRPIVLTQENVPAIFDNNRTFYARLIGERSVDLEHVTYGTLISVLPRISATNEIEMALNIEDGSEIESSVDQSTKGDALPKVGRTRINTVARVPRGKSLLVGGFTRDESGEVVRRIPILGHIPYLGRVFSYRQARKSNMVRVFLIQPKELDGTLEPGAEEIGSQVIGNVHRDPADRAVLRAMDR
ncbi:type III secretion system outer membrane ring subunit SctC [Pseudomonas carnis]|uniref:type III secretion system outer membrane ring subunit SctC n=1 Tax=Pseudomonas TaxID=286 RepID=UPI000F58AAEC|nr:MULTISPECIES: type III secretion system outer membrane ring subunit SctC [Pseudomonas]AZC90121.1 Type III secretion outermembrane pore forming protein (YscC,MxiD,HrcC, InvG) [Pseudomonas chlororaphis subsp. piscium]MBY8955282.1 type III secretion system outer membrane ring subunit SctC [Pseudomonas carnis]